MSIDGAVTITGGPVELSDHANNTIVKDIGIAPDTLTLNGAGLTGGGFVSVDLVNNDTVTATTSTPLTVTSSLLTNTEILQGSDGFLRLQNVNVQNAGGLITGTVELANTTVIGGDIGTAAVTGTSIFDGIGLSILDTVSVDNGQKLRPKGGIDNQGTIELLADDPGISTQLQIDGIVNLSGGGDITLSDSNANRVSNIGAARLVNTDNTISGARQILALGIANGGAIIANANHALSIAPSGGALGGIVNTGTLAAIGGVLKLIGGTIENAGGTLSATGGGVIELNNNVTIVGGGLTGSGEIVALSDVTLDGIGIVNSGNYRIANDHSHCLTQECSRTVEPLPHENVPFGMVDQIAGFGTPTSRIGGQF